MLVLGCIFLYSKGHIPDRNNEIVGIKNKSAHATARRPFRLYNNPVVRYGA